MQSATSLPEAVSSTANDASGGADLVWLDGHLLDATRAAISPFDHGLLTGDGVFETLVARDGEPFAHTRHYLRLKRSADRMGLETPDGDLILEAMRSVLRANELQHARIRVTVTGGQGPLGSARGHEGQTLLVAASPVPDFPAAAKVVTVSYPRNERGALAGIKTVSYGENVVALYEAKKAGGDEAIFGNLAGNLCEGTGTNIFIVRDGTLTTPPLAAGCLAGVTRGIVLDLCREIGIEAQEIDSPLDELSHVDEAFLTSTLRDVQPIETVNGTALPQAPGPITSRLAEAFADLAKRDTDPC
ncbi:MAG: aminotransferase class IV family protein [Verrucomicrobiae bacterium]|nr:aminotransferase class IV family protein [Verrucomicrobiae bacterium]